MASEKSAVFASCGMVKGNESINIISIYCTTRYQVFKKPGYSIESREKKKRREVYKESEGEITYVTS